MISNLPSPSILVIEDSDEDFTAMKRILERTTKSVGLHRCTEADQALALLNDWQRPAESSKLPALIVLDLNMPGRDGRFVLSAVRRQPALRKIPVVIFSTSSDPQDITWCYENGANSYHVKDMDYTVFKQSVEQLSSYWLQSAHIPATSGNPRAA